MAAFATEIEDADGVFSGPLRSPRQMLQVQAYDGHASIHDDATAQKLGFKGGTIEGPTHFSQFVPLAHRLWGDAFLCTGCLSVHYRNAVYEGERVRALLRPLGADVTVADIRMERDDGTEILAGTASVGAAETALARRLRTLAPLAEPVILADVRVGQKAPRTPVHMEPGQNMGDLYPFSLSEKLERITEPSPWYANRGNPWGRPIVPFEMISVLMQYTAREASFPTRGPAVGLFADQEIHLVDGPVFVDEFYEVDREVVFLSGSRRTESLWIRSNLYAEGTDRLVATMLLNSASLKGSYARFGQEHEALYG